MEIGANDVVKIDIDKYDFAVNVPEVSVGSEDIVSSALSLIRINGLGEAFTTGLEGSLLKPNSDWVVGKYFLRLEFVPNPNP